MRRVNSLDEVLRLHDVCIVEFSGPNCPACESVKRKLSSLEKAYSSLAFFEVDVEESAEEAAKYGIMSVPSVLFLADGMVVDMIIGDTHGLEEKIKAFVRVAGG